MTDRFEKFSLTISELYHYLHKITRDEMETYGLNGPHAIYFFILSRYEKGLTAAKLSEVSFRNKSDVSRAMNLFEEKGFVRKKGGTTNSYRAKIVLTEEGISAAKRLKERASLITDSVSKGLTDEKRIILYESLELIVSNMQEICGDKN